MEIYKYTLFVLDEDKSIRRISRGSNFENSFEKNSDSEENDSASIESRFGSQRNRPFHHFKHDNPSNGRRSEQKPFFNQFNNRHSCHHHFGSEPEPDFRFVPVHSFDHDGHYHEHSWHNFDHGKSLLGSLYRIILPDQIPFEQNIVKHLDLAPWQIDWVFSGFDDSPLPIPAIPVLSENNFLEYFTGRDENNLIGKGGKKHHFNRDPTKRPSESKPSESKPSESSPPFTSPTTTTQITTEKTTTSTLFPKIDIRSADTS